MKQDTISNLFTEEFLNELFPPERADEFFDALYGGAEEGAFDIALGFNGYDQEGQTLELEFRLTERPGKCMACSLTYGLPPVFERHPIIGLNQIVERIRERLPDGLDIVDWELGPTMPKAPKLNVIPFKINLSG